MQKTTQERLQTLIHGLEEGRGATALKFASIFFGFAVLAMFFNLTGFHGFTNQEAMESAHLGRQLADGKGYTTDSIRPLNVGLIMRADPDHAQQVLLHPVPDLSTPPVFPALLSCIMKILPFHFAADRNQPWSYQPELWIAGFNEMLFFAAVLVLFQIARRLFDTPVAWLSAIIFTGTEIYWRFSVAGLATIWLALVFLLLTWCLLELEERERRPELPGQGRSIVLAGAAGGLVGIGGLSCYSFAWMIIPVFLFLSRFFTRSRGKLCLCATVAFLVVMAPWITRNVLLSHTPFGTAGYALFEGTPPIDDVTLPTAHDRLERALNPSASLDRVTFRDVINKFLSNTGDMLKNDLPRLGGSWVSAFFACGLLLPFRNPALRRLRYFLVWSLALMATVQALGQTHLSTDTPEINSENLLIILAPLVVVFGAGFFFTLLDQMTFPDPKARGGVAGLFAAVMCFPLILALFGHSSGTLSSYYAPSHIQRTAAMMKPNELMMSDIPWAVAWYGDRPCAWLTLDDVGTFDQMNKLKPVQAVYLTERTADRRFLSQMLDNQHSWERFLLDGLPQKWAHEEVPTGFPLTKATSDYLPSEMFISDTVRWQSAAKQ